MTKFGKRILFFCVLFVGLLPSIGCGDRPPATLTIAEYEIGERTFTLDSVFDSQYSYAKTYCGKRST